MSSVVYSCEGQVDYKKVRRYLRNVDVTKVSTAPPVGKVKANQIYVYRVNVDTSCNFWRFDGLNWKNLRSHVHPEKSPWCRRITFQLIANGNPQNFYRREYYPYGFTVRPPNKWGIPYVLVQYYGSFDVNGDTSTQHGNKKDTPSKAASQIIRELFEVPPPPNSNEQDHQVIPETTKQTARKGTGGYYKRAKRQKCDQIEVGIPLQSVPKPDTSAKSITETDTAKQQNLPMGSKDKSGGPTATDSDMSSKSGHQFQRKHPNVKLNLSKKLQEKVTPSQAYREAVRETVLSGNSLNPTLTPRNLKQAYNIQQEIKTSNQHDDIYETYLFARQNPDIVVTLQLIPQLVMIQMHPDINLHVASLQNYFFPAVFHYDTTFDIGTYYTSILSMRNPVFKNEPLIPVAVMFHETTSESCHEIFFQTIKSKIQANNKNTVIITDREKAIRNAITSQLPDANNIFCWNHIKKNVETWVKAHLSSEEAFLHKEQVIKLLRSETLQNYEVNYTELSTIWSIEFQDYYKAYLEEDVKTSFRPVLESFGIYSDESGITNNPAESKNAFLKRNIVGKNSSLCQTLSVWYFFQVDIMMEVCRGMQGQGNFILAGKAPENIFYPKNMEDLLPKEVISSLVYDGKVPTNMVSSRPYKSKSVIEATTLRGLARFFIRNDRVTLLPKTGSFIVAGLREKTYLVDLRNGSCSCLRSRICEHRMAAMISAGVDGKISSRRCQPNLGNVYKRSARKATGQKRGQGFRLRVTVPKKPRLILGATANPISKKSKETVTEPEAANESRNFKRAGQAILLSSELAKLPRINHHNVKSIALCFPTGNIWLKELKPVQPNISKIELRLLAQHLEPNVNDVSLTWMVDSVVSGFLFVISDLENQGNISITATEAQRLLDGKRMKLMFAKEEGDGVDYHDWSQIKLVLIPYCYQQNHWILIALTPKDKCIKVLDPIAKFRLPAIQQKALENLFNPKFNFPRSTSWSLSYPATSVSQGETALECGPFICFFAEALVRGWSLLEMPEIKQYRAHLISTLVGNCRPFSDKRLKGCIKCKEKMIEIFECQFCKQKLHISCCRKIAVRGREYFIC